ncbi:MAG: CRISPR-associated protein Cas4 [Clostridiaceae bacterium]|nr:CRISPR-associated protein Cas4 [Clostridiaceae bacterium]
MIGDGGNLEVNGTLVWFYCICKREVWLMSRNITPDEKDENIDIGRFIHETTYKRNTKEIHFGNVKFDVFMHDENGLVIGETKKSSKYREASKWQLLFYLSVLKKAGITAKGMLLYPEEKKREEVELTQENEEALEMMIKEIEKTMSYEIPPPVEKKAFCKKCGYREYCYA